LLVRAGAGLMSLEKPIRDIVRSIDPAQPVFDMRPMLDRLRETWGAQRLLSFLFCVFAGLALTLATIGLYGVLAYTALKRVPEIGLRFSLGAPPACKISRLHGRCDPHARAWHWSMHRSAEFGQRFAHSAAALSRDTGTGAALAEVFGPRPRSNSCLGARVSRLRKTNNQLPTHRSRR